MDDQQFRNSGDEEVPPSVNTPPWIVTPPSDPPPWMNSEPPPWLPTPVAPRPEEMPWQRPEDEAPPWAPPPSGEPAWIVSEPPSGPLSGEPSSESPSGPGRSSRPLIVATAVLILLIVAGGGGWFFTHRDKTPLAAPTPVPTTVVPVPDPTTKYPTEDTTTDPTTDPATEPTTDPATEPTAVETTTVADPESEALAQLDQISTQDLGGVTFDGRYVAQVASKNPGTYDRFQTTASGSHTFQATDILAEYQRLRDDLGTRVVLLKSTDFGKHQLYHGAPLYVTFYLGHFGSAGAVRAWCASTFSELSADALADQCAVRKMH